MRSAGIAACSWHPDGSIASIALGTPPASGDSAFDTEPAEAIGGDILFAAAAPLPVSLGAEFGGES